MWTLDIPNSYCCHVVSQVAGTHQTFSQASYPIPQVFFLKKLYALFLICVYMYDVPFVDARGQHGRVGFLLPPLYDSRLLGFCCKKLYRICHLTRSNPLRDSVSFPEEWGRLGGKDVVPNSSWFIISSLIV